MGTVPPTSTCDRPGASDLTDFKPSEQPQLRLAPLLLRNEDRGKQVDVERRSLVLKGTWDGHALELHTVEKRFRLQTGFRLRQELPDFW